MELNAEQIKKALECCSADTADCHSCPYGEFSEGNCFDNAKKDSLALITSQELRIKELTEENKAWQKSLITQKENADKSYYELACEVENLRAENERLKARILEENHLRHQAEEMLANGMSVVKSDTVRRMLQRIKEDAIAVSLLSNPPKFMLEIREDALDQIAKEMLEGK